MTPAALLELADRVERATDEELRVSAQEHPSVHPDLLRVAIFRAMIAKALDPT